MLNAVNLDDRRLRRVRRRRSGVGLGDRADGHGRRGGRGDRRPRDRHRDLPQPADAARRRVRRDAPVAATGRDDRPADPAHPGAAARRLRSSPPSSAGGSASRPHCVPVRASSSSSWLLAMVVVVLALSHAGAVRRRGRRVGYTIPSGTWIPAGAFQVDVRLPRRHPDRLPADRRDDDRHARPHLLDRLHGPRPGYWRFFAYLNLFMFSMLLLVLADNFLVVFVAWELVGLSSYLLIGFWYSASGRRPWRRRRRSSSTASATSASRSGSC